MEYIAVAIYSIDGEGYCLGAPIEGEGGGNTVHCIVIQLGVSNQGGFCAPSSGSRLHLLYNNYNFMTFRTT